MDQIENSRYKMFYQSCSGDFLPLYVIFWQEMVRSHHCSVTFFLLSFSFLPSNSNSPFPSQFRMMEIYGKDEYHLLGPGSNAGHQYILEHSNGRGWSASENKTAKNHSSRYKASKTVSSIQIYSFNFSVISMPKEVLKLVTVELHAFHSCTCST